MNSSKLTKIILPDVSRETLERLEHFERLFRKWNATFNLVAPSTLADLWSRHILDSAQLASIRPLAGTWVDLGSGGGFPGIVMAILMRERNDGAIHLIESIGKKGVFLKMAMAEAGGAGQVHIVRIEDAPRLISAANVITARALAPLTELLALAFPWLSSGATGLFHKGREFRKEIELARDQWVFNLVEHQSKVDAQSVILEISNVSQRL